MNTCRRLLTLGLLCLIAAICVPASAVAQVKIYVVPSLDAFTSISVAKRINVTLVPGAEIDKLPGEIYSRLQKNKKAMANIQAGGCAYVLKAEPTVAKAVKCDVEDGALSVYAEKFKFKKTQSIDLFIVCDDNIRSITGASSSNIHTKGVLKSPGLSVTAEFAMSIHLSLSTPSVKILAKNDSQVWLSGSADNVSANLQSSSLLMRKLDASVVSVTATNGSTAHVNASSSLSLSAEKRSTITYVSDNATVDASSDSTSKIIQERQSK